MHVQVVTFNLSDLTQEEFSHICDEVAPMLAIVPGLIAKIWLSSPETNTYGGVYLWRNREAMEDFQRSDLFQSIASNPHFAGLGSSDYGVLEEYTRITHGLLATV